MGDQGNWAEELGRIVGSVEVRFERLVTAADVGDFVRLSGDDYEAHTDPDFMAKSAFGSCIAHGAMLVGYMSAAGTLAIRDAFTKGLRATPVSLGYDKMRFVAPVYFDDTVVVTYKVRSVDIERLRSTADITVTGRDERTVAVSEHIMKWLQPDA